MQISKEIHFHMGHRIPNHKSKCRNLHGHTYKLEVGVIGELDTRQGQSSEGMVIDFSDLKWVMVSSIYDLLDHGFMIFNEDVLLKHFLEMEKKENQKIIYVNFIPTVENIARWIFDILRVELKKKLISLQYVKLWETPSSTATYTLEDSFNDDDNAN